MDFVLSGDGAGASAAFIKSYKEFLRAAKSDDRAAMDERLAKMQVKNLYENAYFNIARYEYARRWGSASEQRRYIAAAIAGQRTGDYLPKDTLVTSLQILSASTSRETISRERFGLGKD